MADYSKRIPAAIARGKGWFKQPGIIDVAVFVNEKGDAVYVTAGEVALAEALWAGSETACGDDEVPCPPCIALRAYCEKIEGLGHG